MEEREFVAFIDTLAKDLTKHFDIKTDEEYEGLYIIDGIYFVVSVNRNNISDSFHLEIHGFIGGFGYKSSKTYVIVSEYLSTLFVELPRFISVILRELNSCD